MRYSGTALNDASAAVGLVVFMSGVSLIRYFVSYRLRVYVSQNKHIVTGVTGHALRVSNCAQQAIFVHVPACAYTLISCNSSSGGGMAIV